jgi:hypothetical protein
MDDEAGVTETEAWAAFATETGCVALAVRPAVSVTVARTRAAPGEPNAYERLSVSEGLAGLGFDEIVAHVPPLFSETLMTTEARGRPPTCTVDDAPTPTGWNTAAEAGAESAMVGGEGTGVGVGVGVGVGAPTGPPPPVVRVSVVIEVADLFGTDLVWTQSRSV